MSIGVFLKMKIFNFIPCLIIFFIFQHYGNSYAASAPQKLKIATTTSIENTGLLDYLLPQFTRATGIQVAAIAVGSGEALQLGNNCDVDLVFVHSPAAEQQFVASGFGINRRAVMTNDFVFVGPAADPAQINKATSAIAVMQLIAAQQYLFISRGDNSGTDVEEKSLWQQAKITPSSAWHKEVGQGMEQALFIANNQQAYTLTDRSTYLALQKKLNLAICFQGDPALKNIYSVIAVNPKKCLQTNNQSAEKFNNWITSAAGQKLIADYKVENTQLFFPTTNEAK
jgi:tungstate transport system substrate-binding protein